MSRILLAFFLCLSFVNAQAQDPFQRSANTTFEQAPRFLPVEQAYRPTVEQVDADSLRIIWDIADAYYLYRDRFDFSAHVDGEAQTAEVSYSEGKIKDDPYFGLTEVYYQQAVQTIDNIDIRPGLTLSLRSQGCADAGLCYPPYDQYFKLGSNGEFTEISADQAQSGRANAGTVLPAASGASDSLLLMLAFAFLGGAILNLMPCVFPVLGLKVLSFSNSTHGQPINHGIAYSIGVVLSFIAVAAALILLQNAGQAIGWGFQLQSPYFVAVLACLFFVLSLNLLGMFEIGGSWMNVGSDLAQGSGYRSSFFTGVLATVVASPCTAPLMGTAVGFAAAQPAAVALLVFASLGAGMAAPMLLLTLFPRLLVALPKPGQWMVTLRQLMAFPLLATAVWLAWVVGRQTGANGMAATLCAWLLLGFALWLWSVGPRSKVLAAISLAMLPLLLHGGLRQTPTEITASGFDAREIDQRRAAGQAVFLDVTADWCITCAANESLVLNTDDIRQAFDDANVHYMIADWTRYDPAITEFLATFQRNGIPLYVYYPAAISAPPVVLPQVLSKGLIRQLLKVE